MILPSIQNKSDKVRLTNKIVFVKGRLELILCQDFRQVVSILLACVIVGLFWCLVGCNGTNLSLAQADRTDLSKTGRDYGVEVEVVEVEPISPAVLALGQKLNLKILCDLGDYEAVRVWVRPYKDGHRIPGYSAHHLVTVSKANPDSSLVEGYFYFDKPAVVDEARIMVRDSKTKEILSTISYKIDARWAGDPADDAKPVEKTVEANPKNKKRPPDTTVHDVSIANSPILGPKDAPVTIVEFVDFQCPYCVREFPKLQKILDEYPDQVRLVFKHYPLKFHKKAPAVHAATELALRQRGVDAFWMMHQMIMNAPKELDIAQLREYAVGLELNMDTFDKTMASEATINELLKADKAEAGKCNVSGTPTILINGLKLTDRSIEGYKARIDGILAETAK
jgi:protein-disulfide isomerase